VAALALDLDQVADADRLLDDENQPADEIVKKVLRSEAEADRERAAEQSKGADRDVYDLQADRHHDEHEYVEDELLDHTDGVRLDARQTSYATHGQSRGATGEPQADENDRQRQNALADVHRLIADAYYLEAPERCEELSHAGKPRRAGSLRRCMEVQGSDYRKQRKQAVMGRGCRFTGIFAPQQRENPAFTRLEYGDSPVTRGPPTTHGH